MSGTGGNSRRSSQCCWSREGPAHSGRGGAIAGAFRRDGYGPSRQRNQPCRFLVSFFSQACVKKKREVLLSLALDSLSDGQRLKLPSFLLLLLSFFFLSFFQYYCYCCVVSGKIANYPSKQQFALHFRFLY